MSETSELMRFLIATAVGEGAVVISPHAYPFQKRQRDFLDGIRNVPASIASPPGMNPFTGPLTKDGRWMFVWIPDKTPR